MLCESVGASSVSAQPVSVAEQTGTRDFVEYWSAGRLLAQGGNPYSPAELLAVQRMAAWRGVQPLIMWNPPWTLLLTLPFGLLSFTTGQFFWLLFHVCSILVSAQFLWRVYSGSKQPSRLSWILAATFVPTVFVLIIGQITPLVLAGLTGFLYSARRQNYWGMGASLVILSTKPHLLYLFWIVLLFWILHTRPWHLIYSALLTGLAAALLPVLFDPTIYSEYLALYGISGIPKPLDWPAPTLRNVVRILLGLNHYWLEFTPTAFTVGWAVYYWHRHKHHWHWHERLPLLSTVSVASSIFVWTYDQIVLLPAIIEGATAIRRTGEPWHRFWSARLYCSINAGHLLLRFWLADDLWYFWLAPAMLINYLVFLWERKSLREQVLISPCT